MLAFLDKAGLIHDQHRVTPAQLFDHVLSQHIARAISIPPGTIKQILYAVRC